MDEFPNDRDCSGCGQCETCVELSAAHFEENATDAAYAERNRVVALLATLAHTRLLGWSAGIRKTAIEGWDPAWHNCVFINTPEGQLSWHYHDREAHLFDHLPAYVAAWDGHTTPEKYLRIERMVAALEAYG